MSSFGQTIRNRHQSLLTHRNTLQAEFRRENLPVLFFLAAAIGLGMVLALFTTLPKAWLVLSCLAVCGALGLLVWYWLQLPVLPVLRFVLIFSLSFRLEIHFFAIEKHHESPPGINFSLPLILASLLLLFRCGEDRVVPKMRHSIPPQILVTYWLLFVWGVLSVIYGSEFILGLFALSGFLSTSLIGYAAATCFRSGRDLRTAVQAVAVAIIFSSLIGLLQYFFDVATDWKLLGAIAEEEVQKISDGDVSRVGGLLTMANAFAWYLVTFLPLLIAPLLLQFRLFRQWEKLLILGGAGLGTVALILTYARGSWFSFIVSMCLLSVLAYRATIQAERSRYLWRMAGITALVVVLSLPFAPLIYTRLTEDDRGAAQTRIPLMQVAGAMIRDNPLLGVGLSSYETVQREYDKTNDRVTDDFDWPVHNIFLHIAAEAGIPAILLLLLLTGLICHYAWPVLMQGDPLQRALVAGLYTGLFAFLVTGLKELGSVGSSSFRMYALFLGLLIAVRRIADDSRRSCEAGRAEA